MNQEQATGLYKAVLDNFYKRDSGILLEYAPPEAEDRDSCFLFSYFATTGMMYQACKAGIGDKALYRKLVAGFAHYRSAPFGDNCVKYHSERGDAPGAGHGPCFFDDNIWVARNFLFAHEIFGDAAYLAEAVRVVNYTHTAWDEELGGLVWNENGLTENGTEQELERGLSANACSILVNALLYRLTGEAGYLRWAEKFYAFCKTVQDPDSGLYYNGIHTLLRDGRRQAGAVNKDLYAYNPGSMILADLVLHEITGDAAYYEDAELAVRAAHAALLHPGKNGRPGHYRDFVWFLTILAEACQALAGAGSNAGAPVMRVFAESLAYAGQHYKAASGLLPHDYVGGWRTGEQEHTVYDRLLLTHSGTAETAVILYAMGL